ncbi:hypothetical protein MLD38_037078 [Melastoma candidum]|uniref:Uncharacterized protein n=1 Tax=Melastoma candidum TaxID=119954 RepID=A0ACB9LNJ0_9MYRT|nr:hypothetical protein MLD38_037078 [Melastoma candidum]
MAPTHVNFPSSMMGMEGHDRSLSLGCPPGKYQLKFDAEATCYLVKGKVKVYPKGPSSSRAVEFVAGDLVTFP